MRKTAIVQQTKQEEGWDGWFKICASECFQQECCVLTILWWCDGMKQGLRKYPESGAQPEAVYPSSGQAFLKVRWNWTGKNITKQINKTLVLHFNIVWGFYVSIKNFIKMFHRSYQNWEHRPQQKGCVPLALVVWTANYKSWLSPCPESYTSFKPDCRVWQFSTRSRVRRRHKS